MPTPITSLQNPRLKTLVRLRQGSARREAGVIVVEGYDEISLALASGAPVLELYICPTLISTQPQPPVVLSARSGRLRTADSQSKDITLDLIQTAQDQGAEIFELMEPGFHKVSYRQNPDGYLAVLPALTTDLAALDLPENPLIVVCSAIEKPGNLGAILRTADAAGVDAVISTESITDWGNPNVIRASRGTVFTVPIADSTRETLVPWLQERGITILATTPHTPTPFTEVDLTSGVAIIMGSEQDGLSPAWLAAADTQVTIPMHGQVNSLNVATSAALLIYEAHRQRHTPA